MSKLRKDEKNGKLRELLTVELAIEDRREALVNRMSEICNARIILMTEMKEKSNNSDSDLEVAELALAISKLDSEFLDIFAKAWAAAMEQTEVLKKISETLQRDVSCMRENFHACLMSIKPSLAENIH